MFRWFDRYTGEVIVKDELYSMLMEEWIPIGGICTALTWGKRGMSWMCGDRFIRMHATDMKPHRLTYGRRFFMVRAVGDEPWVKILADGET